MSRSPKSYYFRMAKTSEQTLRATRLPTHWSDRRRPRKRKKSNQGGKRGDSGRGLHRGWWSERALGGSASSGSTPPCRRRTPSRSLLPRVPAANDEQGREVEEAASLSAAAFSASLFQTGPRGCPISCCWPSPRHRRGARKRIHYSSSDLDLTPGNLVRRICWTEVGQEYGIVIWSIRIWPGTCKACLAHITRAAKENGAQRRQATVI